MRALLVLTILLVALGAAPVAAADPVDDLCHRNWMNCNAPLVATVVGEYEWLCHHNWMNCPQ
jgi:hypothetical protein